MTPLITLAETQTVSDSRILTVCLTGKLFNRVESGRCGAFLIVRGHFMSSPFCALLVFDFTSIWAILEPQSSTRLGNRLFDREICSIKLSWVGAECSSLTLSLSLSHTTVRRLEVLKSNVTNSNSGTSVVYSTGE